MNLKQCGLLLIGALTLGTTAGTTSANAKSLPRPESRYWVNYHKAYVKKNVTAYHIHLVYPEYKSHSIGHRMIKKGTKIYTRYNGFSWAWIVKGHGMKNTARYFWTVDKGTSHWIYQK